MSHITTYGGADTLWHVFNAVAMLMNAKTGALYAPLMLMAGMVGAVWAFGKAFWESSFNGLIMHWLIPMVVIIGTCFIPSTTVHMLDPITEPGKLWTVDHVPLGLARTVQTISMIGHRLTHAIEHSFSVPGHLRYSQTGMIFGADNLLEMGQYAITNENLASSMRDFVQNCVTFDVLFNLYSMDELKQTKNIWGLIQSRTSKVRMFSLCKEGQKRCELISCREGAQELETRLRPHIDGLSKNHVFKHLGNFYERLTGMQRDATELISQQMMMHSMIDAIERKCDSSGLGTSFAINRAYLQQRHTYEVVGALAAKSLVVLRNVLEALIYAAFIFIAPMALLPMGFKIFTKWLWLVIWIQLWPPFYAILNAGIMLAAKKQASNIPGIGEGLNFISQIGLNNLALDMQAYAAYASLSVPFLSYALLQGGISSLAQVAGSIAGVSQNAGSAAAQDLTTGNYNYGNVQLDTLSYGNQTMLQHNLAPSLSHGHYAENTGDSKTIHGQNSMIVEDPVSQFGVELNGATSLNQSLSRKANEEASISDQLSESAFESRTEHVRGATELMEHASKGNGYDKSIVAGTDKSFSQLSQENLKAAESFGHKYNMDTKTASEFILHAGVGGKIGNKDKTKIEASLGVNFSGRSSASKDEMYEEAKNVYSETSFGKNYQALSHVATNEQSTSHDETGMRLSKSMAQTLEKSKQYQEQSVKHKQISTHLTALADITQQDSVSVNRRYNQEFVDYLAHQKTSNGHERGRMSALYTLRHNPVERDAAIGQFMDMKEKSIITRHDLSTGEGFEKAAKQLSNRSIAVASPVTADVEKLPSTVTGPQDQKSSLLTTNPWATQQQENIDVHRKDLASQEKAMGSQVTQHHEQTRINAQRNKEALEKTIQKEKEHSTAKKAFLNIAGVKIIKEHLESGSTPTQPPEHGGQIKTDKEKGKS